MKATILFLFAILLTLVSAAQTKLNAISSTVKNDKNEIVEGATVRLLAAKDSSLLSSVATDNSGKYHFININNGTYLITIKALGQKMYSSVPIELDGKNNDIELPVTVLQSDQKNNLAEVVIQSKRMPLVQMETDKTVVNVEAMISSSTSNTLEVLGKTPGITVGTNGEISLNGRQGVLVLIDGRSTYMSGQDLAAYLKSIPGSQLDKIELIDNPSARYDAAGNGVINIRLKKNRIGGFTGSVSTGYTQGKYGKTYNSLSLNYNYKKINIFGNLGYTYEKDYTDDNFNRHFYTADGGLMSTVKLQNNQQNANKGINTNMGMDYAATPHTTFGFQFNLNESRNSGRFNYNNSNYSVQLDSAGNGNTLARTNKTNFGTNINMVHKFGDSGEELTADLNYLDYSTTNEQSLQNFIYRPDGTLLGNNSFFYHLPASIHIYTLKADYVHPLKNNAKLEAGFKSSWVNNDNVSDYYKVSGNNQMIDNRQSNHFKYKENINAAYVNGQKNWKYLGIQLGLRTENTVANGQQLGNEAVERTSFKKDYTQFFPSAIVSYKLDTVKKNTFSIALTRRINRPNYQYLNDFIVFRDQYSYTSGNSSLVPQYQYRYEFKYQYKQLLRMGFSYNRFNNVILQTTKVVNDVFITTPQNIAIGHMLILNTGISLSPAKWWDVNTEIRLSQMGLNGDVNGSNFVANTYVARVEVLNQFSFGRGWSAELGGYYASRDLDTQAFTSGMYRVNSGIQKKVFKNMGSIRIAADDIFHSWVYHNKSVDLPQSDYAEVRTYDTQRLGIAFSYRFGKDTFSRKSKHQNNAADEEKGRL